MGQERIGAERQRIISCSENGTLAVIANRKGKEWSIASIKGQPLSGKSKFYDSFLPNDIKFWTREVTDRKNGFPVTKASVTQYFTLRSQEQASGGILIHLKPI